VFKCTQTTHGANWIVEVEGEAILRCSIYATGTAEAIFVSGDADGSIRYAAIGTLTTEQDWQGLGHQGTGPYQMANALAASYARVAGVPTFVLGGAYVFTGLIIASNDGLTWNTVLTLDNNWVLDLFWNAEENSFFANTEDGECWASPDGYAWSLSGGEFLDHVPGGVPDGKVGYDAANDLTIAPDDLDLDFMTVNCTAFADGIWMAGGALLAGGASATATSINGGTTWVLVTSGVIGASSNSPVQVMIAASAADMS
jgi:hypothetical protein